MKFTIEDNRYELAEKYTFSAGAHTYDIPKGFQFDGMSVPWFLRSALGGSGRKRTFRAALMHDYLYASMKTPRRNADIIFYEALKQDGVRMAWIYFLGVRLFGRFRWGANSQSKVS